MRIEPGIDVGGLHRFTNESEIISRYKGDLFLGNAKSLKEHILSDVLDRQIGDYDSFKSLLSEYGATRTRNSGKDNEYQNVKPADHAKGINLKDYVFSREFIEMPTAEKRSRLSVEINEYEDVKQPRPTKSDIAERLQEWREVRADELKYMNSGNRKAYAAFREAEPEQRRTILSERAARFYVKHRNAEEVTHNQEHGQERHPLARVPEQARAS